jgi:4-amino-4-deoxy-L-arabinose transferase-like glycosyltransferase
MEWMETLRRFFDVGPCSDWEKTASYRDSLFVFFLLLVPIFFAGLGNGVLHSFDDMFHAAVGRQILDTGDWMTMHLNGQACFLRPPLYLWLEAILFKFFGFNAFCARLPSAVFGWATLGILYALACRLYNRRVAFLAVILLATTPIFIKYSRRAMTDSTVAFALTLGAYGLVREEDGWGDLLFGLSLALGYYVKAVMGLYGLAIAPAYFILTGQFRRLLRPSFLLSLGLAAALIGAWFWPELQANGRQFLESQCAFGPFLFSVVSGGKHRPLRPLDMLWRSVWPWLWASAWGFFMMMRNRLRERGTILSVLWIVIVLASLASATLFYERYLIPLVPILSLCAAVAMDSWLKPELFKRHVRFCLALLVLGGLFVSAAPVALDRAGESDLAPLIAEMDNISPPGAPVVLYKNIYDAFMTQEALNFYGRRLDATLDSDEALSEKAKAGLFYVLALQKDFEELQSGPLSKQVRLLAHRKQWTFFEVASRKP